MELERNTESEMVFTLIDSDQEAGLMANINGVDCKQASAPHDDKVLWKPAGDWINSPYTIDDLREEVGHQEKAAAVAIAAAEVAEETKARKAESPLIKKGDLSIFVMEYLAKSRITKTIREISEGMGEKDPSVYAAVNRLRARKLVVRSRDKYTSTTTQPSQAFQLSKAGIEAWKEIKAETA
jgi:DNA-binding MarR family transcriptional regulator